MAGGNDFSVPEGRAEIPRDGDDLRAQIQALGDFIRHLKQHADCVLGQSERDRAEEDRRSMHEAFDRWKKESEEYDRRWKESQARWEEMQLDIQQRLKALEGRGSEGSGEVEKTEEEGTADG